MTRATANGRCGDGSSLVYDEPVNEWGDRHQGLPLGNGSLGVMFTGGASRDLLLINHDSLVTNDYRETTASASDQLETLRQLATQDKWTEAQECFDRMKESAGARKCANAYHPVCDLVLEMNLPGVAGHYLRTLELSRGTGQVRFNAGGCLFTRTYFVSAADNLAVFHIAADTSGAVDVDIALGRGETGGCALTGSAESSRLELTGRYDHGVEFVVRARALTEGGTTRVQRASYRGPGKEVDGCVENLVSLAVRGADAVTILLAVAVSHPVLGHKTGGEIGRDDLDFQTLLRRHEVDHGEMFGRTVLRLGDGETIDCEATTDRLVHQAYLGRPPVKLFELLFQMGRYLTMASSRPGGRAINLQGIWNQSFRPPWQSRYQLDMNIQMCYWLANGASLPECNEPLFDLLDGLVAPASAYARDLYGCGGILLGVATDGFNVRYSSNMATQCVAGWLAGHYWDHYLFTQDEAFLAQRAYPFMKQVGQFFQDFLFKDPNGKFTILPSASPENVPANRRVRLSQDATVDIAVVRESFQHLLEASRILGIDEAQRGRWREILDSLPEFPIGSDGALREWADPNAADNDDHRHLSHLYPLFPGSALTPEDAPELIAAAVKAIDKRQAGLAGDACGWTYAWLATLYARVGDGERAYASLSRLCQGFLMDNLLTSMGDRRQQGLGRRRKIGIASHLFQIEAGLGGAAAISEMLLQSHNDLIRILPALPHAWPTGTVRGLRARGGFEVDIEWREAEIRALSITSLAGGACRLKLSRPTSKPLVAAGGNARPAVPSTGAGTIEFDTRAGERYVLVSDRQPC